MVTKKSLLEKTLEDEKVLRKYHEERNADKTKQIEKLESDLEDYSHYRRLCKCLTDISDKLVVISNAIFLGGFSWLVITLGKIWGWW